MKSLAFVVFVLTALAAWPASPKDVRAIKSASERFGVLKEAESPSFRRHVVPLVSRAGCNSRECHGAFSGQGGFSLSLFGYDFENDHREMTKDSDGGEAMVRIDTQNPEQSLLLLKPTMQMKHKGKERFAKGSWEYNLLLKWIMDGAKSDVEQTGTFDRLEVLPKEIVFKSPGEYVQLKVLAHWKDGTLEDVTQLTRFRSNDDSVASVSEAGRVQSVGKGDTHIVAFYDNGVQPIPVLLAVGDTAKYPEVATHTKVDEFIVAKLRKLRIVPSEVCTDAEFLRRASLDVTGTLPTPEEVRSFLADRSPDKRARKIDELLTRPGYAGWFTTLLCDFTGNNAQQLNDGGGLIRNLNSEQSRAWYDWIYKRVADNVSYDELAAGIILASSRTSPDQSYEELAKEMAAYYRKEDRADFSERQTMPYFWARRNVVKPQEKALAFSHAFLGVRIECAECHKHPFDQWTKFDFEQFQVFFNTIANGPNRAVKDKGMTYASLTDEIRAQIMGDRDAKATDKKDSNKLMQQEARRRIDAGELVPWNEVYVDSRRVVPRKGKAGKEINGSSRVITPKILGGEEVMLQEYSDPRQPLMDWLRAKDNPYFARVFVNRIWANYFGRGIVESADDMNLANPPVNEELLDYLARGFVQHGFDMKWLHREILNSDAYQRSWKSNDSNKLDEKNFSRMIMRRLPAEVAMDAIKQATASSADVPRFGSNIAARAIGPNAANRKGNSSYALSTFGKPARVANCDCERTADPTLLQTLFTRNDPELLSALDSNTKNSMGWIGELRRAYGPQQKSGAAKGKPLDLDHLVNELFLRTLSRPPTAKEIVMAKEDIAAAKDRVDGVRDVLWALLNTREFLVNH